MDDFTIKTRNLKNLEKEILIHIKRTDGNLMEVEFRRLKHEIEFKVVYKSLNDLRDRYPEDADIANVGKYEVIGTKSLMWKLGLKVLKLQGKLLDLAGLKKTMLDIRVGLSEILFKVRCNLAVQLLENAGVLN